MDDKTEAKASAAIWTPWAASYQVRHIIYVKQRWLEPGHALKTQLLDNILDAEQERSQNVEELQKRRCGWEREKERELWLLLNMIVFSEVEE